MSLCEVKEAASSVHHLGKTGICVCECACECVCMYTTEGRSHKSSISGCPQGRNRDGWYQKLEDLLLIYKK